MGGRGVINRSLMGRDSVFISENVHPLPSVCIIYVHRRFPNLGGIL